MSTEYSVLTQSLVPCMYSTVEVLTVVGQLFVEAVPLSLKEVIPAGKKSGLNFLFEEVVYWYKYLVARSPDCPAIRKQYGLVYSFPSLYWKQSFWNTGRIVCRSVVSIGIILHHALTFHRVVNTVTAILFLLRFASTLAVQSSLLRNSLFFCT